MKGTLKMVLVAGTTALACGLIFYLNAMAFNGPSQNPPTGGGQLGAGTAGNLSIGTSTPSSNAELLIIGSTTADSGNYSLKIFDSSGNSLFSVRNDGVVTISTSTVISGGSFAGTISAGNVSAGQFGSNTGGGNFTFPAGLTAASGTVALATTTAGNFAENGTDATTTASMGGIPLNQGGCISTTVSVPGAATTSAVIVTPQGFPGAGIWWEGYISTTGTATVIVCAATTTTPTAEKYNVRIIR